MKGRIRHPGNTKYEIRTGAKRFLFYYFPTSLLSYLPTFILLLLLPSSLVIAQQDPIFTQYMYSKLEFNPACAGDQNALSVDMLTRFQWVGVEGAPRTVCLTINTPLRNPHIGLGMYMYRDDLGIQGFLLPNYQ